MSEQLSYLDYNLADVPEFTTVPEGEYKIRCIGSEVRMSKNNEQYLSLRIEIADDPTAKDMNFVVMLPSQADDEKKRNIKLNRLREACKAFDVPYENGIDISLFQGAEAWANVGVEETEEYGTQNRIKRLQ